jgi:ribonuclease P protein component
VVPRYGRPVVDRNRVKRRLREILRREVLPALDGAHVAADVLVRARREAYDAAYGQLRDELVIWVEKRCSGASCSE